MIGKPLVQSLSIVIPAFNEEKRILPTIHMIDEYLRKAALEFEIIVVADGCSDNTTDVVLTASEKIKNLKLLMNEKNRGKGFSVRKGVLDARGALILISDADLSTPIEELEKFLPWIKKGYDIVIGSRALSGSDLIERQPWYRELMGRIFNLFVKILLFRGIEDTQCGFKLLNANAAKTIFGASTINGFAFDVEILLLGQKLGFSIKEVPVRWLNSPNSKINITSDPLRMFLDLIRIKYHVLRETKYKYAYRVPTASKNKRPNWRGNQ